MKDRLTEGGKKTIIGFGNWSNGGIGVKGCGLPVKGLYRYMEKDERIYLTDTKEEYTTKMSSCCEVETGCVFGYKEDESGKETRRVIHGLRRCKSNECTKTWDRDVNASINIFRVLKNTIEGKERPEYLKKQSNKRTEVGSVILTTVPAQKEGLSSIAQSQSSTRSISSRRKIFFVKRCPNVSET